MLRIILLFWFLTASTSLFSQGQNQVSVIRDSARLLTTDNIENEPFIRLNDATLNNGFSNGVYWFKIEIPNGESQVLQIKFVHATLVKLFAGNMEIAPLQYSRYPAFLLSEQGTENTYFLKVDCQKEAYVPIIIKPESEYLIQERKDLLMIGFYYGIVFTVILFHVFHFLNSGKKTYLYYMFMLLSLTGTIGYRDGMTYLFIGPGWLHDYMEPFFNLCVLISLGVFTKEYLQLRVHGGLKQWKWLMILILLPVFSYAVYLLTDSYLLFVITEDLLILLISLFVLFFGGSLFKKTIFAKFYLAAYVPMLVMCWNFYNSRFFGYDLFAISIEEFRVCGIIEMVVFTFAITYQSKILNKENRKLKDDLSFRNKELTTFTLQLIEKNTYISDIKEQLVTFRKLDKAEKEKQVQRIITTINHSLSDNMNWEEFKTRFEKVNDGFYEKVTELAPDLTNSELKLSALMKLKLSSKEAAALLNITERSVVSARSRLRKKLQMETDQNLYEFFDRV